MNITVIDLGGSIVAPDQVDTDFLIRFRDFILQWLDSDSSRKIILVVGGGNPARTYQQAYRDIADTPDQEEQDWIGITATHLNARLLKAVFQKECSDPVVTNPEAVESFKGRVLIAAGWKPGFSTDFDSVVLAERYGAESIINLSNIDKIYTADPKKDPDARPLDQLNWSEYRVMCGDEWIPGFNTPFDPVASKRASELNLKVIFSAGKDILNLKRIFEDRPFTGTTIGPE